MKRFHVHVAVHDLKAAIRFYSSLFDAVPTVLKPDYAKWLLDDPGLNFAISARDGTPPGLRHLGLQADSEGELTEIADRLKAAGETTLDEKDAPCCYAISDKAWVEDPAGLMWENFRTHGVSAVLGGTRLEKPCCGAAAEARKESSPPPV